MFGAIVISRSEVVSAARCSSDNASATSTVCMNFLAMPTLKNERACFLWPISIRPFRSLNDTFDSARMGMANVGSLDRSAAEITMSAIPMSFFSTTVGFFCLVVMVG